MPINDQPAPNPPPLKPLPPKPIPKPKPKGRSKSRLPMLIRAAAVATTLAITLILAAIHPAAGTDQFPSPVNPGYGSHARSVNVKCGGAYPVRIEWLDHGHDVSVYPRITVDNLGAGRVTRIWGNAGPQSQYRIFGHWDYRSPNWYSTFHEFDVDAWVGSFEGLEVTVQVWNQDLTHLSCNDRIFLLDTA